jgi:hypothetical protein
MAWRPLSLRNDPVAAEKFDALHDGVPEWLAPTLVDWFEDAFPFDGLRPVGMVDLKDDLHGIELLLHRKLDWTNGVSSSRRFITDRISSDDPLALDLLDCCLAVLTCRGGVGWRDSAQDLEFALSQGGSAWKVAESEGMPCLERRVDEVVEKLFKEAATASGNAAHHLRMAWHKTYGRQPDASGAYREAVRAVEAAAKPVVTPNDPKTTFGKMLAAMRVKPAKWVTELGSVAVVIDLMNELWTSQLDRHGTDDESVPLNVSLEQAAAALHIAALLVHWCQSGAFRMA